MGYNTSVREYCLFLRVLERLYTARIGSGQLRDAADCHAWLMELSEIAAEADSLEAFFKRI